MPTTPHPSTRRRRRGTGHELRAVLVEATTELLAKVGDVDALTMRAVADAAGVTPPSVYRHFPDKESLLKVVLTDRFAELTDELNAAATAGSDPFARLEAMSGAYVRFGLARAGHYRALFSAANAGFAGLGLPPGTPHPGAAAHQALVDAVAACLPRSRADAAPLLAAELWASLHGVVDLRITKPDMPWPEADDIVRAALAAVRAAAGVG